MIPNYQVFMRFFLDVVNAFGRKEVKFRDLINQIAQSVQPTENDQQARFSNGKQTVLYNPTTRARTSVTRAARLKLTRRAHFVITERERKAVNNASVVIAVIRMFRISCELTMRFLRGKYLG